MGEVAAIFEMDEERDRKSCVSLDLKISGANQELAQWLWDHPRYSARVVADWLGCSPTRVKDLRRWADNDFQGPLRGKPRPSESPDGRRDAHGALKSQDNPDPEDSDDDSHDPDAVAEPSVVEENALDVLGRITAHATAFKKIFKLSHFDPETETRISNAIDRMIAKWQSARATLTRKD